MKRSEMLDLMGEIDSAYIEDTAAHLERSPRRLIQRFARPASAVAVAGFLGFSFFLIYGIVRDGIASQNPSSGSQPTAYAPETTLTADTVPPEDCAVMTETIVITTVIPAETTTETTVSTMIPTYKIPEDEMPSRELDQEVGSRFASNGLSTTGIFAMTVNEAQCFDTLADAGLTFDDLTYQFRWMIYHSIYGYGDDFDEDGFAIPSTYTPSAELDAELWNEKQQEYDEDYRFVKLTLTVENINAQSPDSISESGVISGKCEEGHARDYDFDMDGMHFGIIRNPDYEPEKHEIRFQGFPMAYFSLCGQIYPKDDVHGCGDLFHLEPGETMTCEVGGFLPKSTDVPAFGENLWQKHLFYEEHTDLLPYYCFGIPGFSGTTVMLSLTEEQKTEE